jgi:hypothetical protein
MIERGAECPGASERVAHSSPLARYDGCFYCILALEGAP